MIGLDVHFCRFIKKGGSSWQARNTHTMLRALLRSSIHATRRAVAWNLQDLSPPSEKHLFKYSAQSDLKLWEVYGDSEHGGLSTASLQSNGGIGIFSGNLSEALSNNEAVKIKRSGFSGFRTIEGLGRLDLEPFDTICLRLKGDGRCYISNLRTESWVGGLTEAEDNTWQAFIFAPKDKWCELQVDRRVLSMVLAHSSWSWIG
ncbi:hypothetical protein O6H91_Y411800 [Diphasiastrum complanatum]|nr:hypothetical protein O6H91_Y411800 [Diphasiastrum complanatum]